MLQPNPTDPFAYDPCRPVHYVFRPDNAPVGGEQAVHAAFARISEVTGLRFVHDGSTDEPRRAEETPERGTAGRNALGV